MYISTSGPDIVIWLLLCTMTDPFWETQEQSETSSARAW